jgi:hypothetical protein
MLDRSREGRDAPRERSANVSTVVGLSTRLVRRVLAWSVTYSSLSNLLDGLHRQRLH